MAHYLVTGGAGFIGSHLVETLFAEGHRVRVLDNLSTGRRENLPPAVELITADVVRQDAVRAALEGVDGCFHLAAIASVDYYRSEWRRANAVNLGGTITVFDAVRRAQAGQTVPLPVVYASSAAVYGDVAAVPIAEDAPTRPINGYGADKFACELHAAVAGRVHGMTMVGLRFFNVYGARQDPNSPYSGVISIFCERMLRGDQIEIHGDGGQVRDFIHVDDAVTALRRAMGAAGAIPQVFNVCTGVGTTVCELAATTARICGIHLRVRSAPARAGDIRTSIGDPGRAADALGFRAKVKLADGLARTLPHGVRPADRVGGP